MTDRPGSEQRLLRIYLRGRHERCPRCGYDLCNLGSGRCPECGDALCLGVKLVEPRLAAFITGLVLTASSFGFSGLFLFIFIAGSITYNDWGPVPIWVSMLSTLAISGLIMYLWISQSRWIRRTRPERQWILAGLCALLPVGNGVVFYIVMVMLN